MSQPNKKRQVLTKQLFDTIVFKGGAAIPQETELFTNSYKPSYLRSDKFPTPIDIAYNVKSIRVETSLLLAHGITTPTPTDAEKEKERRKHFFRFINTSFLSYKINDTEYPNISLSSLLGYQIVNDGSGNLTILARRGEADGFILPDSIEIEGNANIQMFFRTGDTSFVAETGLGQTINGETDSYFLKVILNADYDRPTNG